MMMSQNALDAVEDVGLNAGDFYAPAHRTIFEAIHKLREAANEQVDELTVTAQLQQDDQLENVGGQTFVYSLTQRVPAVANTRSYAEEVVRQSTLRALVRTGETISALGYEHPDDPQALIDQAGTIVMDLTRQREQSGWEDPSSVLGEVFDELSARAENGGRLKGLTSGFADYDAITGGLHPSTVSILAARPAMGKTAWALNVVENVALRAKKPVAVFSLEMDAGDLLTRMMCSVAKVDSKRIRIGVPHNDDWPLLVDAIGRISAAKDNLYIDQSSSLTPLELRSKCRRLHQTLRHKGGLGLIVIDYLQLMEAGRRMDNRQVEIAFISRQLKTLARELKVPIIALSQLSRAVEARVDKRPILSDLRESGSIEQDADLVMFLHRPEYYEQDNPELRGLAELIIAKHRNGEVGTINLGFRARYTQFVNLTKSASGPGGVPSGAPGGMPAAVPGAGMAAPAGAPMPSPGFGAGPASSGPPVGGFHDDGPV
jgi:replicative DNA helicase